MNVMLDILNPTKHLKYVVLLNYLKEKSIKKLLLGVYLKISRAQTNKRNNHLKFVNIVIKLNRISQVIFMGSLPKICKSLEPNAQKITLLFWQETLTIHRHAR